MLYKHTLDIHYYTTIIGEKRDYFRHSIIASIFTLDSRRFSLRGRFSHLVFFQLIEFIHQKWGGASPTLAINVDFHFPNHITVEKERERERKREIG